MHTYRSYLGLAGRTATMAAFLMGTTCFVRAEKPVPVAPISGTSADPSFAPDGLVELVQNTKTASYSSSKSTLDALSDARLNLFSDRAESSQPPPRRRYGRPNYSDSHTNPDGSSKFAFMAGGGASIPVQDTGKYLSTSYAFQVGAGRNFNKNFGVMFQFDYDHFGFQGSTLTSQQNLYNSLCGTACISGLDGTSHIWSFTLDPTFTFYGNGNTGAYVVGGLGFYHKRADFTVPATGTYCDYYYGCYPYQANQPIDWYTSNAFGLNGGVGLTYKPSRFANQRIYVEARYVWMDNSPRVASFTNLYPPNANQTYYIPVTVGLRF